MQCFAFLHRPRRALAALLVTSVMQSTCVAADTVIHNPDFKAYDMSGLSWLPPSLVEKGYEKIPVLFMCHMWNPRYGHEPTNCNNVDFSSVNHDVVRQRGRETIGVPLVVIDIERTHNPTSEVWHMLSDDPAVTNRAVELWQEMIAVFREENPDTEILIYKPIQRIWWPMIQNRQLPLLKRGQSTIDARYATAERVAPLFDDTSLLAWPSAYVDRVEPEIYRAELQWQINICKELFETRCIFALSPIYPKAKDEAGNPLLVDEDWFYQMIKDLEEDGADGFGVWLPYRYDNPRYIASVQNWEERGGATARNHDPRVHWLSAIDRFLSERQAVAEQQSSAAADGD